MAFLRASLRAGVQVGYAPHIALAKVSNLLWDSVESHQFITAIYGILDATNRTFVFSNAGHNPPLVLSPNGDYRFVEYGDLPLGMFKDMRYHQHFIKIEKGEALILYTDGLTEAMNDEGEEYGSDRFARRLLDGMALTAREMIDFVRKDVADFTGKKFLADDGTLFIIKGD
jgi:sigma-B regulation protein RsbU (phosphoserine phosphatase)